MFHVQNKNAVLRARAQMYKNIRDFFASRNVLEVETPLLAAHTVSDPYIQSFAVQEHFLQTSPEYAMKRLLASGSGCIYQICKAFRCEEAGSMHNPEFTMLEWYRLGYDHMQLLHEMDELLQLLLDRPAANVMSYQSLFEQHFAFNPHTATIDQLQSCANNEQLNLSKAALQNLTATDWLQLLMSHVIEPKLTGSAPWIIYNFPAPQAALAKILPQEPPVAARFEVYIEGIELANGYYELQDASEQKRRFIVDNKTRKQNGQPEVTADTRLLSALEQGLPDCAGVALGLDRLLMLQQNLASIKDVLAFPIEHA